MEENKMLRTCINYSDGEIKLFSYFGFTDLLEAVEPLTLYRMAVSRAFADNDQTAYADSLRRCVLATDEGWPYRLTAEFNALIKIPENGQEGKMR
jgi:hypothetical protein